MVRPVLILIFIFMPADASNDAPSSIDYVIYGAYPPGEFTHSIFGLFRQTSCQGQYHPNEYCHIRPQNQGRLSIFNLGQMLNVYWDFQGENNFHAATLWDSTTHVQTGAQGWMFADDIHFLRTEYRPKWFSRAYYHYETTPLTQEKASSFCSAIGGYLSVPRNEIAFQFFYDIVPYYTKIWTGIYLVNGSWQRSITYGKGAVFNETEFASDKVTSSGGECLIIETHYRRVSWGGEDCMMTLPFVCTADEATRYTQRLIRLFDSKRGYDAALEECKQTSGAGEAKLLNVYSESKQRWLRNLMAFYGFSGLYFVDGMYSDENHSYITDGGVIEETLWQPGQPDSTKLCVAMDASASLLSYDCNDQYNAGFACEILDKEDNFLGIVRNSRYSSSLESKEYSEATNDCALVDGELMNVQPYWIFARIMLATYRLLQEEDAAKDYWVALPDDHAIENGVIVEGSDQQNNRCPAVSFSDVPYFYWKDCYKNLNGLCQSGYQEEISKERDLHCLPGFMRIELHECLRFYGTEMTWGAAYATCSVDTGGLGSLVRYHHSFQNINLFLKTFVPGEDREIWTGMCGKGTYKLYWRSQNALDEDLFAIGKYAGNYDCAVISYSVLGTNTTSLASMFHYHPFLCQHGTVKKSTLDQTSIRESSERENQKIFGPHDYCRAGYYSFEGRCLWISHSSKTWKRANNDCKQNRYGGYLVTDDSPEKHKIIMRFVLANHWTAGGRFWIGLSNQVNGKFSHYGTSNPKNFSAWKNDDSQQAQGTVCVTVDYSGVWESAKCDENYPYVCETPHCYEKSTSGYDGDARTSISGFECQPWKSQSPHNHTLTQQVRPYLTENYCRDNGTYSIPWCFTKSPEMRYEICDVYKCDEYATFTNMASDVTRVFSNFVTAKNDNTVSVDCKTDLLVNCECGNEHCIGLKLVSNPNRSTAMNRNLKHTCIEYAKNYSRHEFKTRAKAECISEANNHITRSMATATGSNVKMFCPSYMTLTSCILYDPGIPILRPFLGIGNVYNDNSNKKICRSNSCYDENCQLTAVCTLMNHASHPHVLRNQFFAARSVHIAENPAIFIYPYEKMKTACFWMKPAIHGSGEGAIVGTVAYLARTGRYPVLALSAKGVGSTGVFFAPNDEKLNYDPSQLLDGDWHQVCVTFGAEQAIGPVCQLYIDGMLKNETDGGISCDETLLEPRGHFLFGGGLNFFMPSMSEPLGNYSHPKSLLHINDEEVLKIPFKGDIGDISIFKKVLSADEIQDLFFSCNAQDWYSGVPPEALQEEYMYVVRSDTSRTVYTNKVEGADQISRPCSEGLEAFYIDVHETAISIGSSHANLTVTIQPRSLLRLTQYSVQTFNVSISCFSSSNAERNRFTRSYPSQAITESANITFSIINLLSATQYSCVTTADTDLVKSKPDNNREINFFTRLSAVTDIRSLTTELVPSYKILFSGTDLITWQPPDRGQVMQYNVTLYIKSLNGTHDKVKQETYNVGDQITYFVADVKSGLALPGATYKVIVVGLFGGVEGDSAVFISSLQPERPVLQEALSVGFRDHVNLKVRWVDPYSKYIDGYILRYKLISGTSFATIKVPKGQTEHIIPNLKVETIYDLKLSSFSGTKTTNESELSIQTSVGANYAIDITRTSPSSVLLSWMIYAKCHEYQVGIEAVRNMNPDKDISRCFLQTALNYIVLNNIHCNERIKRFQDVLEQNVEGLKTGCAYRVWVKHITLDGIVGFSVEKVFSNPDSLTPVRGLTLESVSEDNLTLIWTFPDPTEEVDTFLVTLSFADRPYEVYQWQFVIDTRVTFFNLTAGTKYVASVTSGRSHDASEPTSVTVWTGRSNFSSLIYLWSEWTSFSECDKSCGIGALKSRKRYCQDPYLQSTNACYVNDHTMTEETYKEDCNLPHCPVDGRWSSWSQYSKCDKTCGGGGLQFRNRNCSDPIPAYGGKDCNGGDRWKIEYRQCGNVHCPIHGGYTTWIKRFFCSSTCGAGTQSLFRLCRNPVPKFGGFDCVGIAEDSVTCNTEPCPVAGEWQEWTDWTECLNECGVTKSTRQRMCFPSAMGLWCEGSNLTEEVEERHCISSFPCEGDFHWGAWNRFSSCPESCGTTTTRQRMRKCVWNNVLYEDAKPCEEVQVQALLCGIEECPIHGGWTEWSTWSPCSVSCGEGEQIRMRLCENPFPAHGGSDCVGASTGSQKDKQKCVEKSCPGGRYRNSPSSVRHCEPERGESGLGWEWTFAGLTRNSTCPDGTVGTAYRQCGRDQQWLEEDLSGCTSESIKEISDLTGNVDNAGSATFGKVSRTLLRILDEDHNGEKLSMPGDVLEIYNLLKQVLSWKPSEYSDLSRADKLEYVDTIATSIEKITHLKYQKLWMGLNGTTILKMIKNFLSLTEMTSEYGQDVIQSDSTVIYKNNLNENFHLKLQTIRSSSNVKILKFPAVNTPEHEIDKSVISIELDPTFNDKYENSTAKVMFVRYNTMPKFIYELDNDIKKETGRKFQGRKINGVLIGAMLNFDGVDGHLELNNKVKIYFHHERKSKNPLCVFVDERPGKWLFSEDGCRIDDVFSTAEMTICICDHLTTFTVLTHDFLDEEMRANITRKAWRNLYIRVSLAGTVCLFAVFVLVLLPTISLKLESGIPVQTTLSGSIRHLAILCASAFSSSDAACSVTASCFAYSSMAYSTWCTINCLDVLMEVRCGRGRSQDNYSFMAWIMPLSLTLMILITYGLSASNDIPLACHETYSAIMLGPAIALNAFAMLVASAILIHAIRSFTISVMKPLEANRIEKRIWMVGFLLFVACPVTVLSFGTFMNMTVPSYDQQLAYVCVVVGEMLYLSVMHLWMDTEIRAYYHMKIGAMPVEEKVTVQPPKYIP